MNLPALRQNKNRRLDPFPRKWSVLQNPDRERTNQSAGICPRLALPYNNMDYDKLNGYFVQFPDDVDWIKTLNSRDVRIIK